MFNTYVAFAELFTELLSRKTGHLGRVSEKPQKPSFRELPSEMPLPVSTPEQESVSSDWVRELAGELYRDKSVHLHQLMIVRHGRIIFEGSVDPYREKVWHVTYSMCKSFVNMAIGLLYDDGKLNPEDPVASYFPDQMNLLDQLKFHDMKIRHLLTMSSGSSFNEIGAVSGDDWVHGFFSSALKFQPGTRFDYNSMNTYILSAIVTRITGMTVLELLRQRILNPMGIRNCFWEESPQGLTKAGWGMFLLPEDAAKLGLLYLNYGRWNGQQLISEEWVRISTASHIMTGKQAAPEYGYQIWMGHLPDSFLYNGMLGQNVYVFRKLDLVIVTNAGNEEVFAGGGLTGIIHRLVQEKYFAEDRPLPPDPAAFHAMERQKGEMNGQKAVVSPILSGGWKRPKTDPARRIFQKLKDFCNTDYIPEKKGIGLLPLMMQVVHNNYTRGIRSIRLEYSGKELFLIVREGTQVHRIPISFTGSRSGSVTENGEEYMIGTKSCLAYNEEGIPVLTVRIAFLEEAAERLIKIQFLTQREIRLRFSETPGDKMISGTLGMITGGTGNVPQFINNALFQGTLLQLSGEILEEILNAAISPVITASAKENTAAETNRIPETDEEKGDCDDTGN